MRILLVEDEPSIRDVMKVNLEMEGYELVTTAFGKDAIQLNESQHFDLIILDLMLPDVTGLQVCEQMRINHPSLAILIVSAKDSSNDRIAGLRTGADDYLVKPFHLEEFLLRVEKLIKRSTKAEVSGVDYYEFGGNKINLLSYEAQGIHGDIMLTKREAQLLKLLIERKNEVVSRQQILQIVWGFDVFPSTRTIDNFILAFRKYFEKDPKNPQFFQSVRGVGYRFTDNSKSPIVD